MNLFELAKSKSVCFLSTNAEKAGAYTIDGETAKLSTDLAAKMRELKLAPAAREQWLRTQIEASVVYMTEMIDPQTGQLQKFFCLNS